METCLFRSMTRFSAENGCKPRMKPSRKQMDYPFSLFLFGLLTMNCGPSLAQDQGRGLAVCKVAEVKDADATVQECTRLIDRELSESAARIATALNFRGLSWRLKGENAKAVGDFSEAIKLNPNVADAYEARADVLRDSGQCDAAISDYDRALELRPEWLPAYFGRGACLLDTGATDRAVRDFDRIVASDVDNKTGLLARTWRLKSQIASRNRDIDKALFDLGEAIRLEPQQSAFFLERGAALASKSEFDNAFADFDQAIKLDTNNHDGIAALAWAMKARIDAVNDQSDKSLANYAEAIRLEPANAIYLMERGNLHRQKGNISQAFADFDKAIEIDPIEARYYGIRGDAYRSAGDYQRAIKDYGQAIERQPADTTVRANRALVRFTVGDFAKAADDLRLVVEDQQNAYSAILFYLSRIRAGGKDATGEFAKAVAKLNRDEWPYPIVELYLGKKSAKAAEDAAKTTGEKCEAQFYIGEWYLLKKDKAEATKALQAAADTCPKDFVEASAAVEELKRLK